MTTISRSRAAFWGALAGQVLTIVSMLIAIITTPMMVKYLDKEEYGLSILFFQILSYLALFDFGLSSAVIRALAIHQGKDENAELMLNRISSTSFFSALGLGAVMVLLTCALAPFIPQAFHLRADLAKPAVYIVISLSFGMLVQFVQRGLGGIFFAHHRQEGYTQPRGRRHNTKGRYKATWYCRAYQAQVCASACVKVSRGCQPVPVRSLVQSSTWAGISR